MTHSAAIGNPAAHPSVCNTSSPNGIAEGRFKKLAIAGICTLAAAGLGRELVKATPSVTPQRALADNPRLLRQGRKHPLCIHPKLKTNKHLTDKRVAMLKWTGITTGALIGTGMLVNTVAGLVEHFLKNERASQALFNTGIGLIGLGALGTIPTAVMMMLVLPRLRCDG